MCMYFRFFPEYGIHAHLGPLCFGTLYITQKTLRGFAQNLMVIRASWLILAGNLLGHCSFYFN